MWRSVELFFAILENLHDERLSITQTLADDCRAAELDYAPNFVCVRLALGIDVRDAFELRA